MWQYFLWNNKPPAYADFVNKMLVKLRYLSSKVNLKLHFLFSHFFLISWNTCGNEWGTGWENPPRYSRNGIPIPSAMGTSMIADHCWMLQRGDSAVTHKEKTREKTFQRKMNQILLICWTYIETIMCIVG